MNKFSEPSPMPSMEPEHRVIATDFANAMLERFEPAECNEMLAIIRQRWLERRQFEIENLDEQIKMLSALRIAYQESLSSVQ